MVRDVRAGHGGGGVKRRKVSMSRVVTKLND